MRVMVTEVTTTGSYHNVSNRNNNDDKVADDDNKVGNEDDNNRFDHAVLSHNNNAKSWTIIRTTLVKKMTMRDPNMQWQSIIITKTISSTIINFMATTSATEMIKATMKTSMAMKTEPKMSFQQQHQEKT